MDHGMLNSRDDRPIASSTGFGATTTTTRGISGVEADDDDGVELVLETQKIKKDPTKITWKHVYVYIFIKTYVFVYVTISLVGCKETLRKINVARLESFEFYLVLMF